MAEQKIFQVGHSFEFYGSSYQIVDISYGSVRYSATKGGQTFRIPKTQFEDIVNHEKFLWDPLNVSTKVNTNSITNKCKRQTYISAALRELVNPSNERQLKILIPIVASEMSDESPPSAKTVGRWIKQFQLDGLGLDQKPRPGNLSLRYDPLIEQLILEAIQKVYLTKERRSAVDVESYLIGRLIETGMMSTERTSIKIPTRRTIQRRISQLDPYVVVRARRGEHAAQRYARSTGRTLHSYTALTIVQIDSHTLDVIVIDDVTGEPIGRPYLVCIVDIATRMIVGYHVSLFPPSATTTLAAMAHMLTTYGIPAQIVPDNGVELKNTAVSKLCAMLFISIVRAQVRDPNGKANVESFFRSLTYSLTQKLPGTTFSNPTERGAYDSKGAACFTLSQLRAFIHEWIHNVYHKSIHSTTGRAPELSWRDETKAIVPPVLSQSEVQVLVRQPHQRTIHNGAVTFDYLVYASHALAVLEGEAVTITVDELDLSFVYVQHPKKRDVFIKAESTNPQYTAGLTIYEHRETLKIKKELSKKDVEEIGQYSLAYARYLLLERINEGAKLAKKWLKSILAEKNKESREETIVPDKGTTETPADSFTKQDQSPPDSVIDSEYSSIKLSLDK